MRDINKWREKCYANVSVKLYSDLQEFRSRYPYKKIKIDGQEWKYILTDGGSKVLLMLPGSTATGESNWREIPRYVPGYRVLSMSYPPVKSAEDLFKGIVKILDTEGIELMDIFGASMGAAIAHWLIRNYPNRVNKLVLLSIGMPEAETATALRKASFTFSFLPSFLLRKMFDEEALKLVSVLPEDEARLMSAYLRDQYRNDIDKRTILGHFRLVADIAEKLTLLGLDKPFDEKNPVLIINTADDETFSKESKDTFIATYPNAYTYLFPSGGHTLFGRRLELNKIIDDFLLNDIVPE